MAFKIDENRSANSLNLTLSGQLDEEVNLQNVSISGCTQLTIDFNKVELINSCGVREWISWITTVPNEVAVTFQNVPKVLVTQMNTVVKFFPPHTRIESFYVPYVCESCNHFKSVLYRRGNEFEGTKLSPGLVIDCEKCQKPMEMDVVESKYFRFLSQALA